MLARSVVVSCLAVGALVAADSHVNPARLATKRFIRYLESRVPAKHLVERHSAREAFHNPITAQLVCFTGKPAQPAQEAIESILTDLSGRQPLGTNIRELGHILQGKPIQPANRPEADGFVLAMVTDRWVSFADDAAGNSTWLRSKLAQKRRLAVAIVVSKDVPLALVWQRYRWGRWKVVAFTPFCD